MAKSGWPVFVDGAPEGVEVRSDMMLLYLYAGDRLLAVCSALAERGDVLAMAVDALARVGLVEGTQVVPRKAGR